MLGLLRRFHRIEIQFNLQSEMSEDIVFPRARKNSKKEGKNNYVVHTLNDYTDSKIYEAIKRAHIEAKAAMETLGMSDPLKKHSKWDNIESKEHSHLAEDCNDDDSDESDGEIAPKDDSSLIKEVCSENPPDIAADIHSLSLRVVYCLLKLRIN